MQKTLQMGGQDAVLRIFGPRDAHLKRLRDAFGVQIVARGDCVRIEGDPEGVRRCEAAFLELEQQLQRGGEITMETVEQLLTEEGAGESLDDLRRLQPWPGVVPRTSGQASYVHAMMTHDIVLCVGPAGTGKTYLGVAVALHYLEHGPLKRIVLCRPAVEAGESLGFLPGDMYAKVNPYLRPLYDALHDLLDVRRVQRYIETDLIEILPLAFVRGRTLDNAFIILDEAQNCTVGQMKTFLSRLGPNAKLLVTGDVTQIDLPPEKKSGLVDAQDRLRDIPGICIVRLSDHDIVRHPLVRRILEAYDRGPAPDAHRDAHPEVPHGDTGHERT